MLQRPQLVVALLCLQLAINASPAAALELRWSNGAKDLYLTAATRCTLTVSTAGNLPNTWHLLWSVSRTSNEAIAIVPTDGSGMDGDVCSFRAATSTPAQLAHADTVLQCASASVAGQAARYVLDIPSGISARFRIVTVEDSATSAAFSLGTPATNEASINGGTALGATIPSMPPIVERADLARTGGRIAFIVRGWHLDAAQIVRFRSYDGSQIVPLHLQLQRPGSLIAKGLSDAPLRDGYLSLESATDFLGAADIAREPDSTRTNYARDRLIIRFQPSAVTLPTQLQLHSLAACSFVNSSLRDSLVSCGISSLRAALPTFSSSDIHSRNLQNEDISLDDLTSLCIAQIDPAWNPRELRKRVARLPGVLFAEPDYEIYPFFTPNDSLYSQQWGLQNSSGTFCGHSAPGAINIQAYLAWDRTQGSSNVNVAFLDTGVDSTQRDLYASNGTARVRYGPSYDPNTALPIDGTTSGHGTAVMGIACATGNNSIGIAGVAWNVTPWAVKIFDDTGFGYISWLNAGIDWARSHNMAIANISGGYPDPVEATTISPDTIRSTLAVCLNARSAGMLVVAASGNAEIRPNGAIDQIPVYPASADQRVCAVGAMDLSGGNWRDDLFLPPSYCTTYDRSCLASNFGGDGTTSPAWLDLIAPGGRLITTLANTTWQTDYQHPHPYHEYLGCHVPQTSIVDLDTLSTFGGTSAAAPYVTGVAALLASRRLGLNGEDLEQLMKLTAFDIRNPGGFDPQTGWGVPRLYFELNYLDPRLFGHWQANATPPQGLSMSGTFSDTDSLSVTRSFVDVPSIGPGSHVYTCWRHKLTTRFRFPVVFTENPRGWYTAYGSLGWKDTSIVDYNYEVPWGQLTNLDSTGVNVTTYVYRLPDTLGHQRWVPADPAHARVGFTIAGTYGPTTSVDGHPAIEQLEIRATPNPARNGTWLSFAIPTRGKLSVEVFDASGRRVRRLAQDLLDPGRYRIPWDGRSDENRGCPAGVYFCRLQQGGKSTTGTVILLSGGR